MGTKELARVEVLGTITVLPKSAGLVRGSPVLAAPGEGIRD